LSQAGDIKWDKIQSEIQKATDAKIGYTRVNGTEGHFAVDLNKLDADLKAKVKRFLRGTFAKEKNRSLALLLRLEKSMLKLKNALVMTSRSSIMIMVDIWTCALKDLVLRV